MDAFTLAYLEAALWASSDENDTPFDDNYDIGDIAPSAIAQAEEECRQFQTDNAADLAGLNSMQAGHDFWLTRNRHGAGFWDRGLGTVGQRLTDAAHAWGSSDVYVGDDGQLYLT